DAGCLDSNKALSEHSANQQLFAAICFNTLAVAATLDPTACLANIFGSPGPTPATGGPAPRVVVALNMIARGDIDLQGPGTVLAGLAEFPADQSVQKAIARFTVKQETTTAADGSPIGKATVDLNIDPFDGPAIDLANASPDNQLVGASDFDTSVQFFYETANGSLSERLTVFQEAILGCGELFKTSCDLDGVDFLNMEASAIFQSWPDVDGTFRGPNKVWDTTDRSLTQPGTVGFQGGPICTRFENGKTFILPGCRGPGDPGYNVKQDGSTTGLLQPFTGQQFQNELAALSWNLLMGLVGLSLPPRNFGDTTGPRANPRTQDFDASDPFRHGGCSFAEPQWGSNVGAILDLAGPERPPTQAGGNGRFGRRDFVWHSGGDGVLRVDKNNFFGFSMDFAEDVTKSNWGVEFTCVKDIIVGDNNSFDGIAQ